MTFLKSESKVTQSAFAWLFFMKTMNLNIAVLDPNKQKSTYSYHEALIFRDKILTFAFGREVAVSINIISCETHAGVIAELENPNTLALQPISNTSTGLVPVKVFAAMVEKLAEIEFFGGVDLKIENRLIVRKDQLDLLLPENYKYIDLVLTHLAPQGQCQKQIDLIKIANPKRDLKIVNTFASTTAAVEALKSQEYISQNVVAIGNLETAQTLGLNCTSTPWQDYPENNLTTFLVIADKEKVDNESRDLVCDFFSLHSELGKIDFIASLPISDDLGSLGEFLSNLKEFGVNLNYIKVDTENGKVKPYFSGTVSIESSEELKDFISSQNANLNVAYQHIASESVYLQNRTDDQAISIDSNLKIETTQDGKVELTTNVPNIPGALADILKQIKVQNLNLTSLEVFARGCEPFAILKAYGRLIE